MRNFFYISFLILILTACGTKIPLRTDIDDRILMPGDDKKLKANYELNTSFQSDEIDLLEIKKKGKKTLIEDAFEYSSNEALKTLFSKYFDNKFNELSDDVISINLEMKNLYLEKKFLTSTASTALKGYTKYSISAIGSFVIQITYKQKDYNKKFKVEASDYNESQKAGNWTTIQKDPTEQKSLILQSCFNRAIIKVDKLINNVLATTER